MQNIQLLNLVSINKKSSSIRLAYTEEPLKDILIQKNCKRKIFWLIFWGSLILTDTVKILYF